jgi:hypothetical protein
MALLVLNEETAMSDATKDGFTGMGEVIRIDEARVRDHLGEMVRGTVCPPSAHVRQN